MKKRVISLVLALMMLIAVVPARAEAAQNVTATVASFKVTLNGVIMDNTYAQYPLIVYKDITYFPMTYYDCRFMAVKTDWNNDTRTLSISAEGTSEQYRPTTRDDKNPRNVTASIVDYNVIINGKKIDNLSEPYPLLSFRNVTYFPMTWRFCVDEFGWEYSFTQEDGLIVDSKGSTRLRMTAEEKELANKVARINCNHQHYDEDGGYRLLRFALMDSDGNEIKSPAVADIVIENDNGEVVYSATKVVSSSDFSTYDINGTKTLRASIRVNDSEIAVGSSGYGTLKIKVRNEGYFTFNELIFDISTLPLTEEAHEVKMTAEEKELARQVYYISQRKVYSSGVYGGDYDLMFSFLDKDMKEMAAPAVVDIVIENDNGEVVYSATKVVSLSDFERRKSSDGTNFLKASVRINRSEITAGTSEIGTIKFTVHNEGYFFFNEESFTISNLPLKPSHNVRAVLSSPLETIDEITAVAGSYYAKDCYYGGNFRFIINSVDGVILSWGARNTSDKTIKYITFTVEYYNNVGDPAYDEIKNKNTCTVRLTGPIEPGKAFYFRKLIGYGSDITYGKITTVKIEYMDGTIVNGNYGYTTRQKRTMGSPTECFVIED